jgi:hypothetical protein
MQRHAIGLLALGLLALGVAGYGRLDGGLTGTSLRIGCVLALFWLAWPQLRRVPIWLVAVLGVSLFVILRWPKLLLAALPLAIGLWLLRPRGRRPRAGVSDPRD